MAGCQPAVDDSADLDRHDETSAFPADFVELVRGSDHIVRARIVQIGASTEPPDQLGGEFDLSHAAIVRFEKVFEGDTVVKGGMGTIVFVDEPPVPVGKQLFVFSRLLVAGQTVVLSEVGHMRTGRVSNKALTKAVESARRFIEDAALFDLLTAARAVAVVEVGDIVNLPGPIGDIPDWHEAAVQVRDVLAGDLATGVTVAVRFDVNDAIARPSPRLVAGQVVLLALFPDDLTGAPGAGFVLSRASELRSASEAEQVAALLADPPVPPTF